MNQPQSNLEGSCACGATRFELVDKPLFVHACHCVKCQKAAGSVFGITTFMLEKDIRLVSGSLDAEALDDAPHRFRHVCTRCHDHIYTTATNHPATALFRVGTLDDPRQINIDAHIFTKRKRSWLTLPEGVPQFDEGYDRQKLWTAANLKRLEDAIKELDVQ